MNWTGLVGQKGRCHIYIDPYKKKDGTDGKSNKIKKFYAYDETVETVKPAAQPAYQQPVQYTGGWQAGKF